MLIYLDTNIYLDYLENRSDRLRPLGEIAFQLIKRALQCEFKIIISDIVLRELNKYAKKDKINLILEPLKKKRKIISIESNINNRRAAAKLQKECQIPFFDALHYVLAISNDAEFLVTNDNHFNKILQNEISIVKPNLL